MRSAPKAARGSGANTLMEIARRSSTGVGAKLGGREIVLSLLLLAIPIGLLAHFGQLAIEAEIKTQLRKELEGTVSAIHASVERWLKLNERAVEAATMDQRIITVSQCMATDADSACLQAWATAIAPYQSVTGGKLVLLSFGPEPRVIAADSWSDDEKRQLLQQLSKEGLGPEKSRFVTSFKVGEGHLSGGFLARIGAGSAAPFLFFELDHGSLGHVLEVARAGDSGETYALDRAGRMLTNSRFLPELRSAGLLMLFETTSVLNVEVRDPGVNLRAGETTGVLRFDQPLTRMAAAVTSGHSGVDVDGYRDYMGVPVVGAWRWLSEFGMGVTIEIDQAEAFAAGVALRRQYFGLLLTLASLCVVTAIVSFLAFRIRSKAAKAVARSRELGQYHIHRELGRGGMGAVYLATHALLKRPTAVKVIRPERDSPEALARFEREARATSELTHPNTISIYDFGAAQDGSFYYAMELLRGLDLEQLITKYGPMREDRLAFLLKQACGSLEEAHARELVHRDIKPSNLFVCNRPLQGDVLKVLDFGIVKEALEPRGQVTRASTVVGTPEYMSPEMFDRAHRVGPQSDIYSLGATAYFALTGKPLFYALTMAELCTAHLTETPRRPSEVCDHEVDPELEAIIMGCLSKAPGSRPDGAAGLRLLLQALPYSNDWTVARAEEFWRQNPPP